MKFFKNLGGIANIRESFKTRHVKYGGYAALITLAVIIGLILLNLMMGQLSMQIDMTRGQIFTLSDQTLEILGQLESPVRIYGLWRPGQETFEVMEIMDVVNLYVSRSRNIIFEVLDPDRNPGFMMRYDRDRMGLPAGSLIIEGDMGFRILSPFDMFDFFNIGDLSVTDYMVERRITSAIIFVGTGVTPVIYELTGHDQIVTLAEMGFYDYFERENYDLRHVNLLLNDIPDDASVIILQGPNKDLTPLEVDKLLDYLDRGGRFLVMANYNAQDFTNLNNLLASYGIAYDYGIAIEMNPSYSAIDPRMILPDLSGHEITAALAIKERTPVLLMETASISEVATRRRETDIVPLMISSSNSFLRTDIDDLDADRLPSDVPGPLMLAAAVSYPGDQWRMSTDTDPQSRIVAFACPNFLAVGIMWGFDANLDVFMNAIGWLHDRPEQQSVRSRSHITRPVHMTFMQIMIFGIIFIAIIPLSFFGSGFVVWLRRRHL